jgi:hypothetical protein
VCGTLEEPPKVFMGRPESRQSPWLDCIKQTWNISYNQNGDSLVLANWVCYNVPYDSAEWFLDAPWHITLPTWRGVSGGKQQFTCMLRQ